MKPATFIYKIDGKEVTRAQWQRHQRRKRRTVTDGLPQSNGAWRQPLVSTNLGCHSSQVAEFREKARAAGLTGVDYTDDGRAVIATREQRKKLLRLRGFHDMDGGYGDG